MLLAGDIGGTKTLLGVFDRTTPRPHARTIRGFSTLDYADLSTIVTTFLRDAAIAPSSIDAACFGVAGPVIHRTAQLTNVPWHVDAAQVGADVGISDVSLLNDLEAMACSLPVLTDDELCILQEGKARLSGNVALIAAGTGLGEAFLHRIDGAFLPAASEAGHADFAPRNDAEVAVMRSLTERYGRAEVEHVISGRGLANIHVVTHRGPCAAGIDVASLGAPAAISTAALTRQCEGCVAALDLFVGAYGAEAGNLALRTIATGGVFVGGGIAPKILPALTNGAFMRAFRAKAPFELMLSGITVAVILNADTGLLGAAVFAAGRR